MPKRCSTSFITARNTRGPSLMLCSATRMWQLYAINLPYSRSATYVRDVTAAGRRADHIREPTAPTATSRSGSRYGSGFSTSAWRRPKMAELAPMPTASVATATSRNVGAFANDRMAARRSDAITPCWTVGCRRKVDRSGRALTVVQATGAAMRRSDRSAMRAARESSLRRTRPTQARSRPRDRSWCRSASRRTAALE